MSRIKITTAVLAVAFLFTLLLTSQLRAAPATPNVPTAVPDQARAVENGVIWLVETHQNSDGGYTAFSAGANQSPSSVPGTLDAVLAIAATGHSPAVNYPGQTSNPIAYLQAHADDMAVYAANGGGNAGKVLLALTAVSQNPRDFGGYNFVISTTAQLSPTGQVNATTAYNQSLALLGLIASREPISPTSITWLKDQQTVLGSWSDGFGVDDNPDATALAIMALVAAGETPSSLNTAVDFLISAQNEDGGWGYTPTSDSNPNSTALVIQALKALGEDFYSPDSSWAKNGVSPLAALLSFQSRTGAFQADFGSGPFDDFYATVQSLTAVVGQTFPLPAPYEATQTAVACLATLQDDATGGWEQFAGFGVNAAGTARAMQAIDAAGGDPQAMMWTTISNTTPISALQTLTPDYLAGGRGGRVGIVMQGVVAAGTPYSVTNFVGYNLPLSMTGYLSPTGEYADTGFGTTAHSEAMLGLLLAGETPDPTAVAFLQNYPTNGDWGSPDTTGLALNVLGRIMLTDTAVISEAIPHLQTTQYADGGWTGFGDSASPSSTSEVVQGLVQVGQNPSAPAWRVVVSGTLSSPADAILAQQGTDGCWPNLFGPGADPFGTTDAIMLLTTQPTAWTFLPEPDTYQLYLPLISRGE